ncbi:MAG: alpha/beta hydrolase [Acetobacteraceae bacterium]|nr:alpha/beta hydrolase [Acetobacteraceae bacterium]
MRTIRISFVFLLLLVCQTGIAQTVQSRFILTSDGVRLHYLEAGRRHAHTILFVPGWTMPAWVYGPPITYFSRSYHVIALDPRGQGESEAPPTGYEPNRRAQDIAEVIANAGGRRPVVVVGWSLGVLDTLAYVWKYGDARLAGLVLIDNSVGEDPPPAPHRYQRSAPVPHDIYMRRFVRSMFRKPQPEEYIESLTEAALRTPEFASAELLAYPVPRSYWREAIYSTLKPILYAVRPGFAGQAENLTRRHPSAESVVFADAGHALFIDEAARFNATMEDFIHRRIWP